jgi:hypothetical protein
MAGRTRSSVARSGSAVEIIASEEAVNAGICRSLGHKILTIESIWDAGNTKQETLFYMLW